LLGGLGRVGRILAAGLADRFEPVIVDLAAPPLDLELPYVQADITEFERLGELLPPDAGALINLTALPDTPALPSAEELAGLARLYVVGAYNVYRVALDRGIRRVVYASTNHVSGRLERGGYTRLGRAIDERDPPAPDTAYAALKGCAEQLGRLFAEAGDLSVICLRLGSVATDEVERVRTDRRLRATLLSQVDLIGIFAAALTAKVDYGIYYAVSDNPGRPWSIRAAIRELGYRPRCNSRDLLRRSPISPRGQRSATA
jgi:nucleoside-diphosphate-sugar epimerase